MPVGLVFSIFSVSKMGTAIESGFYSVNGHRVHVLEANRRSKFDFEAVALWFPVPAASGCTTTDTQCAPGWGSSQLLAGFLLQIKG